MQSTQASVAAGLQSVSVASGPHIVQRMKAGASPTHVDLPVRMSQSLQTGTPPGTVPHFMATPNHSVNNPPQNNHQSADEQPLPSKQLLEAPSPVAPAISSSQPVAPIAARMLQRSLALGLICAAMVQPLESLRSEPADGSLALRGHEQHQGPGAESLAAGCRAGHVDERAYQSELTSTVAMLQELSLGENQGDWHPCVTQSWAPQQV